MYKEPAASARSKTWPESHPSICLIVATVLGVAFVVWAAMAGTAGDFADWF